MCRDIHEPHNFQHRVGPFAYVWGTEPLPEHLFVVGDMMSHAWKHLFTNTAFDLMVMSPPCQPWSLASLQQGLSKMEGRLTLHAWGPAHFAHRPYGNGEWYEDS